MKIEAKTHFKLFAISLQHVIRFCLPLLRFYFTLHNNSYHFQAWFVINRLLKRCIEKFKKKIQNMSAKAPVEPSLLSKTIGQSVTLHAQNAHHH